MNAGQNAGQIGPAGRIRGPWSIVGSLLISGQKTTENGQKSKIHAPPPTRCLAGARAMFFSNNYVKNDMNVSRETLPNK